MIWMIVAVVVLAAFGIRRVLNQPPGPRKLSEMISSHPLARMPLAEGDVQFIWDGLRVRYEDYFAGRRRIERLKFYLKSNTRVPDMDAFFHEGQLVHVNVQGGTVYSSNQDEMGIPAADRRPYERLLARLREIRGFPEAA